MSVETKTLSKEISEIFWREGYTLATAESCTAGNVAAIITAIPGSSRFYKGGIVAYDNKVKQDLLHVSAETLEKFGAVSEETVVEMVKGGYSDTRCRLCNGYFRHRWPGRRYTREAGWHNLDCSR